MNMILALILVTGILALSCYWEIKSIKEHIRRSHFESTRDLEEWKKLHPGVEPEADEVGLKLKRDCERCDRKYRDLFLREQSKAT